MREDSWIDPPWGIDYAAREEAANIRGELDRERAEDEKRFVSDSLADLDKARNLIDKFENGDYNSLARCGYCHKLASEGNHDECAKEDAKIIAAIRRPVAEHVYSGDYCREPSGMTTGNKIVAIAIGVGCLVIFAWLMWRNQNGN